MLVGCASLHLSNDPDKFREEVKKHIVVGTPVAEAKNYLKSEGFRCVTNSFKRFDAEEFEGHTLDAARLGVLTNVTVLIFYKYRYVFPLERRNYTIGLLYDKDARISAVLAGISTTSL